MTPVCRHQGDISGWDHWGLSSSGVEQVVADLGQENYMRDTKEDGKVVSSNNVDGY